MLQINLLFFVEFINLTYVVHNGVEVTGTELNIR